jgi:hypothetical protein
MALSLHAQRYRHPEFLRLHEKGRLTVYILTLTIVVIAILVAGISLFEGTRSFLPQQ